MNENVTNKTLKRRKWIARLLVSALCILLASSLLFVSVVAENVNSFELVAVDNSVSDVKTFFGVAFFDDGWYGSFELDTLPNGKCNVYLYRDVSSDYISSFSGVSLTYPSNDIGFVSYFEGYFGVYYSVDDGTSVNSYVDLFRFGSLTPDRNIFIGSGPFAVGSSVNSCIFYDGTNYMYYLYYNNSGTGTWVGSLNGNIHGWGANCVLFDDTEGWFAVSGGVGDGNNTNLLRLSDFVFLEEQTTGGSFASSSCCYSGFKCYKLTRLSFGTSTAREVKYTSSGITQTLALKNNSLNGILTNSLSSLYVCVLVEDALFSSSFQSSFVGFRLFKGLNGTVNRVYATSSEYVPPESSDGTTTEPPPEISEPGEPGMLNIYRTDIDRSGGVMVFKSTLDTSIPSDGLESLSAYLGYYWDVDSSAQPPPSYMYLWASYEDGTRRRYDFDFSAYGYALGSDFAQNFYYPDYLGMEFEIPLNGETDIYFVTSSPGGSVTVENSDGRIITLNFGSTSSYARIDFVDELNYRITLYNNDMAIGNSLTFDQGVYRYLFVYNVDSAVNTWYYPESGTSTLINYDKVKNGLYNVVLTLNDKIPDYGKPGDFENAVSWYEEIEGAVSSTMSETWEYLESLQEELNGSFDIVEFSEANAKLDQILSTPGGDTIFTFFKSLWGINPLLPTFAVMTVCFAGVTFIIRKI